MEGPGVAPVKHKDLDKLGDQLSTLREDKASLAEKITDVEKRSLDRMTELGLSRYRFRDLEMTIKPGNPHVKIKEVKVGSNGNGDVEIKGEAA